MNEERVQHVIASMWDTLREAVQGIHKVLRQDPKFRRMIRKRNSREKKRQAIEDRQVARAYILVNRAPSLIHNGKAWRR